jgi:DNA primase
MDQPRSHQHGFTNLVACMALPVTADRWQLRRYTHHFAALDADAAGQQATIRGLNQKRQALGGAQAHRHAGGIRWGNGWVLSLYLRMPAGQTQRCDPKHSAAGNSVDEAKPRFFLFRCRLPPV